MTKNQNEQEHESDAALVERIYRWGVNLENPFELRDFQRLIALARRAAAIPDAGAEDVERVALAMQDASPHKYHLSYWRPVARAALAVMPRRDERAGMLRTAEIAKAKGDAWFAQAKNTAVVSADYAGLLHKGDAAVEMERSYRAEAEALRTSTPEQPRDDGWGGHRDEIKFRLREAFNRYGSAHMTDIIERVLERGHPLPPAPVTK